MKIRYFLITLLIPCFLLSPSFAVVPGMAALRAEDVLLVALLVRSLVRGSRILSKSDMVARLFFFWILLALLSIATPGLVFGNDIILSDFMFIPMLVKYWLIYRIACSIDDTKCLRFCLYAFVIASALSTAVGILQHSNMFGINVWLTPLYMPEGDVNLLSLITGHSASRIVGTHGDPRRFGYMLVVMAGLYISIMVNVPRLKIRALMLLLLSVTLLALIFTLSRTAILALLGGVFLSFFLLYKSSFRKGKALSYIFFLAIFIAVIFRIGETKGFQDRVLETRTESYDTSLEARIRDSVTPIYDALENPIIFVVGRGPSKAVMRTTAHSDWGWTFHRYGIPGLVLYILLVFKGLKAGIKSFKAASTLISRIFLLTSVFVVCVWAIFACAEDIFKDPQLMAINMFALGFLYNFRITEYFRTPRSSGTASIIRSTDLRTRSMDFC